MAKSPLQIIIELLSGLSESIIRDLNLIYAKFIELFISLSYISKINPLGFFISVGIGAVFLFFIIKFALGESKSLLMLLVVIIILILLGLSMTLISTSTVTNSTLTG